MPGLTAPVGQGCQGCQCKTRLAASAGQQAQVDTARVHAVPGSMPAAEVEAALATMDAAVLLLGTQLRLKQVELSALQGTVAAERKEKARLIAEHEHGDAACLAGGGRSVWASEVWTSEVWTAENSRQEI